MRTMTVALRVVGFLVAAGVFVLGWPVFLFIGGGIVFADRFRNDDDLAVVGTVVVAVILSFGGMYLWLRWLLGLPSVVA